MYAVVGIVKIDRSRDDEAQKLLEEFVIPTVTSQDGFASATWSRSVDGDTGHSMLLFDRGARTRHRGSYGRGTAARSARNLRQRDGVRGRRSGLTASLEASPDRTRLVSPALARERGHLTPYRKIRYAHTALRPFGRSLPPM
jgi:hypothetical protein